MPKKSPFPRTFANQVKKCGEMTRKLLFFRDQIHKSGITSFVTPTMQLDFEVEKLEIQLVEWECKLGEINHNGEEFRKAYNELLEFKIVLQKVLCRCFCIQIFQMMEHDCCRIAPQKVVKWLCDCVNGTYWLHHARSILSFGCLT